MTLPQYAKLRGVSKQAALGMLKRNMEKGLPNCRLLPGARKVEQIGKLYIVTAEQKIEPSTHKNATMLQK